MTFRNLERDFFQKVNAKFQKVTAVFWKVDALEKKRGFPLFFQNTAFTIWQTLSVLAMV